MGERINTLKKTNLRFVKKHASHLKITPAHSGKQFKSRFCLVERRRMKIRSR